MAKRIKHVSELPAWFKLEKYSFTNSLNAWDWYEQLSMRSICLYRTFEHMNEKTQPSEGLKNAIQALRENPNSNIQRDIGHLPDTIMDRAITLELRRKLANEKTERLRHVEPNLFKILTAKLARFAQDYSDPIQQAKPELPDALNDRAQDNWEPLLAIADIAGNEWPRLARSIATKISGDKENSQSIGVELLSDIQEIFESKDTDRISSAELIRLLCADEEKPWATYNRNASIKPRQIATRLREFGILSNTIRIGIITAKGYMKAQFTDTFARYLTLTNVTTPQAYSYHDFNVTDSLQVTDEKVTRHYEVT